MCSGREDNDSATSDTIDRENFYPITLITHENQDFVWVLMGAYGYPWVVMGTTQFSDDTSITKHKSNPCFRPANPHLPSSFGSCCNGFEVALHFQVIMSKRKNSHSS
jgi:hypothetical protein